MKTLAMKQEAPRCAYSKCRVARRLGHHQGITCYRDDKRVYPFWVCSWAHLVELAKERIAHGEMVIRGQMQVR